MSSAVVRKSALPLGLGHLLLPPPRWLTQLNILQFTVGLYKLNPVDS
jgi:hypothetical protein